MDLETKAEIKENEQESQPCDSAIEFAIDKQRKMFMEFLDLKLLGSFYTPRILGQIVDESIKSSKSSVEFLDKLSKSVNEWTTLAKQDSFKNRISKVEQSFTSIFDRFEESMKELRQLMLDQGTVANDTIRAFEKTNAANFNAWVNDIINRSK